MYFKDNNNRKKIFSIQIIVQENYEDTHILHILAALSSQKKKLTLEIGSQTTVGLSTALYL